MFHVLTFLEVKFNRLQASPGYGFENCTTNEMEGDQSLIQSDAKR